ncbi:MAG TPA: hypothetical protein VEA19_07680 [Actinomycetota bacterium]|nr:hypothetical protein [Actinomycetota bacterium]
MSAALVLPALPAAAQDPARTETITYQAIGEGSGVRITLAPQGSEATEQGGALTEASVDQKPSARALGEGVRGVEQTTVSSSAPPDQDPAAKTGGAFPATGPAGIAQISGDGGSADSKSEAADKSPSAEAVAEFAESEILAGALFSAKINIGRMATSATAAGTKNRRTVTSGATSGGVDVTVTVSAEAVQQLNEAAQSALCTNLSQVPNVGEQLGTQCAELLSTDEGEVELMKLEVGEGRATCGWKDEAPSVSGSGSAVKLSFLGVALNQLSNGAAQTLGAGTPLVSTIGAGAFSAEQPTDGGDNEDDKVSGVAGGAFADLFNKQIQLRFSASSCSISARVNVDEVLAATGGRPLFPIVGGTLLVAAALLLRRSIRRRDALV